MKLMGGIGINKRQLAIEVGVTPAAMGRYVEGRVPRADELLRISRFFKVPMERLLTGDAAHDSDSSVLREEPPQYGGSTQDWRDRARDAEAKVEMLKSGMTALLKKI